MISPDQKLSLKMGFAFLGKSNFGLRDIHTGEKAFARTGKEIIDLKKNALGISTEINNCECDHNKISRIPKLAEYRIPQAEINALKISNNNYIGPPIPAIPTTGSNHGAHAGFCYQDQFDVWAVPMPYGGYSMVYGWTVHYIACDLGSAI